MCEIVKCNIPLHLGGSLDLSKQFYTSNSTPTLQMKKVTLRKVKWIAKGYSKETASQG